MKNDIFNLQGEMFSSIKNKLGRVISKMYEKTVWIQMFVSAGRTIAEYENSTRDEQGEIRSVVFCEDNMKKMAEYLYHCNEYNFLSELDKCLENSLETSALTIDNKNACKKHFVEIIKSECGAKYPDLYGKNMIQNINDGVEQLGNQMNVSFTRMSRQLDQITNNQKQYQDCNNRNSKIHFMDTKISWHLSYQYLDCSNCTKDELLSLMEVWKKERNEYPGWFVAPIEISKNLSTKTNIYFYYLLDSLDESEIFSVIYEYVWRYEIGFIAYEPFFLNVVYDVWNRFAVKNFDEQSERLQQWFFIGRALLREFREKRKDEDWNKIQSKMQKSVSKVENGQILLQMEEIRYWLSKYNIERVRNLLRRLNIPKDCYEIRLFRAGVEAQVESGQTAESLVRVILTDIEEKLKSENIQPEMPEYVRLNSIGAVALHLYSFVVQGLSYCNNTYEQRQEEINRIFDIIEGKKIYFDLDTIKSRVNEALLMRQTKRNIKKDTFELDKETVTLFGGNVSCSEAYYLYRFLEICCFPLVCNHVTFISDMEIPWIMELRESYEEIVLGTMLRCGKDDIGAYILDRLWMSQLESEVVSKDIQYLLNVIKYNVDEFEEIPVVSYIGVIEQIKGTIPEILVRYMSRCSCDMQREVLQTVKLVLEKENVVMNLHMDQFVYGIMRNVSEEIKAEMLPELARSKIVEHKVMHGHFPSVDLFDCYFRKEQSKKYCERNEEIEKAIQYLLSDDEDDLYIWQTKVKRLKILEQVGLLSPAEKDRLAEKLWRRVNKETKLPDIPNWYIWAIVDVESGNSLLPVPSIKKLLLSNNLMKTMGNEEGCHITMGDIRYIDEIVSLTRNTSKDFWTVDDVKIIFSDVLDYWQILKTKLSDSKGLVNQEYHTRIRKIKGMISDVCNSIKLKLPDDIYLKMLDFIDDLEKYDVGSGLLKVTFMKQDNVMKIQSEIIENLFTSNDKKVIDSLQAANIFLSRVSDTLSYKKLLDTMLCLLKSRKEPGLESLLYVFCNLIYVESSVIANSITEIDKCLVSIENSTRYRSDMDEKMIRHNANIRKACAALAFQIIDKYQMKDEYKGVKQWLKVCNSDMEFTEVKNEMLL